MARPVAPEVGEPIVCPLSLTQPARVSEVGRNLISPVAATVVGSVGGWLTQFWLLHALAGFLRTDLPPAGWLPVVIGLVVAVAMLVDRSAGQARFDVPAISLLELSFPTYAADAVPDWLAKIPVQKPGS